LPTNSKGTNSAGDEPKIVISVGDTMTPAVSNVVSGIEAAKQVPLVRDVGVATASTGSSFVPTLILTVAGAIGGLLVWLAWTVFPAPEDDAQAANIQTSVTIALVLSLVLVLADGLQSQSASKLGKSLLIAVPAAIIGSLVFGYIASELYVSGTERIWEDLIDDGFNLFLDPEGFFAELSARNHLNRGIAWMFMGVATGLALGASTLAAKRLLVTSGGGLVGGFIGGFAFDFFQGESEAQIVGLAITGAAIGLSMGLLEQAVKSSWLQITHGGMAGKQFILYKPDVTIGSSPAADVTLIKDPAIPGLAGRISRRGSVTTIESLDASKPVMVNGVAATQRMTLRAGSVIQLGGTNVVYNERTKSDVSSSIVRG
jgi:uncharacterized Tic20 family protein